MDWDAADDMHDIRIDERIEAVETRTKPDLYEYAIGENWRKLAGERHTALTAALHRLGVAHLRLVASLAVNAALVVALVAAVMA
ncbi:hypothetical protein [Williamsia serinedens]|uniref:Uncharacterized protein n=1 Tax=Williamsia serinedens TaxID=391736 RepID=A0ABT1H785_9NOCA|nr:hypothetical protein [Williamsia serinedens]MCP2163114.1 hypothetical protein [Williamsia serinedens]